MSNYSFIYFDYIYQNKFGIEQIAFYCTTSFPLVNNKLYILFKYKYFFNFLRE